MRIRYSETGIEQEFSELAAEQMYDALSAIWPNLPPGHAVESFSLHIDVTMKEQQLPTAPATLSGRA